MIPDLTAGLILSHQPSQTTQIAQHEEEMEKRLRWYNETFHLAGLKEVEQGKGVRWIDRVAMVPGLVLDFTGENWDFNDEDEAKLAESLVREKRALLVKVCPDQVKGRLIKKLQETAQAA